MPSKSYLGVNISDYVDLLRVDATRKNELENKSNLEQFFSPAPLARLMASMFQFKDKKIAILDPGAGVGSLFAACVEEILSRKNLPSEISVTTYEVDSNLIDYIRQVFKVCEDACRERGVMFSGHVIEKDFIQHSASRIGGLFAEEGERFNCVIMNPPYGKINVSSEIHRVLKGIGMETTNLYTAFMTLAEHFLDQEGELVSISPRSFCNGPYFRHFRIRFFKAMKLKRIHLFTSRTTSFREDEVLQENIIVYATKTATLSPSVMISTSEGPDDDFMTVREVESEKVVRPNDSEAFVHIVTDDTGQQIAEQMLSLKNTLPDLGLEVSTGRLVDFRALDYIKDKPTRDTVPLIHPANLKGGFVEWPLPENRKQAYVLKKATNLLVPNGNYVLTKRFSTNEERRRIVAAVYDSKRFDFPLVAFENRVNYFHSNGKGLDITLAKGLAMFLNSTTVDLFFRQFNGHTQVNATDLRSIRYPTKEELIRLGRHISERFPDQSSLDEIVQKEIFGMSQNNSIDPVAVKQKVEEAITAIKMLGMPRQQQNERSALTLLALLDLKPADPWSKAKNPMRGIRPLMDYFAEFYGKKYAENTRESVRRQTVHQFMDASIVIQNPDDPRRPINSDKNVYQIEKSALEMFRTFGTSEWEKTLQTFQSSTKTLKEKYAREREMQRIPVKIKEGKTITISPGGQNELVGVIIEEFGSRFTNGGMVIYIGDTDEKMTYVDKEAFAELNITLDKHGKAPDLMIYDGKNNWLFLIEAVTSHGPVNARRREQLQKLFGNCKAGLVYVTAFTDKKTMMKHLSDISWETEVWVAESPSHMIHFNGERFLGPYGSQ